MQLTVGRCESSRQVANAAVLLLLLQLLLLLLSPLPLPLFTHAIFVPYLLLADMTP
jgi:hypothetical protein